MVAIGSSYHGFLIIWVLNFDHVIMWSRDLLEFFHYLLDMHQHYIYTIEKELCLYLVPVKSILTCTHYKHTDTHTDTQHFPIIRIDICSGPALALKGPIAG